MTRCSLIVVTYEARELVLACLQSLSDAVGPTDEIIVVENGSRDGSAQAIAQKFPAVKLVMLSENRYIFGLNDGLAQASGEFVAFCNNDMTVDPGFVDEAIAAFTKKEIFAVCPRVLRGGQEQGSRTSGYWKHGLLFYQSMDHISEVTRCFFAVGGQSFFRRDVLVKIGALDELLWPMYHEDIELSYRAWRSGYEVVYAPGSVCYHLGGWTSSRVFSPTQLRSFVRQNELLTVWKDITSKRMIAEHCLWLPVHILAALVRGDRGTIFGYLKAGRRLPRALRARSEVSRLFTKSDREVLDMIGGSGVDRPI